MVAVHPTSLRASTVVRLYPFAHIRVLTTVMFARGEARISGGDIMAARIRALVNVERPVIIIVDDAATPAEEYLEIEFETHAEAHAAVEKLNEILRSAKEVAFKAG
jgi:hypothetical protein